MDYVIHPRNFMLSGEESENKMFGSPDDDNSVDDDDDNDDEDERNYNAGFDDFTLIGLLLFVLFLDLLWP